MGQRVDDDLAVGKRVSLTWVGFCSTQLDSYVLHLERRALFVTSVFTRSLQNSNFVRTCCWPQPPHLLYLHACETDIACFCIVVDNVDLGTSCGKYFRVSVLSITDPGEAGMIAYMSNQVCSVMTMSLMIALRHACMHGCDSMLAWLHGQIVEHGRR